MKNTFFKVLALTLTLIMAMSIAVQAAPALVKGDAVEGVVTVNVSGVAATDEVTLLVVKAGTSLADVVADDIYYIDQATAVDGAAAFSFAIDTEEFDVYSGYSSMAVDSNPLSDIYETEVEPPVGDDKPVIDMEESYIYDLEDPYDFVGFKRVFIKLTEENGAWTPAHSDEESAIFYSVEREGYDGLVNTTSEELDAILDEITWEKEAPSYEATIVMYGDLSDDEWVDADDYVEIQKNVLGKVTFDIKANISADVYTDGWIDADDYVEIQKFVLDKISSFDVSGQ